MRWVERRAEPQIVEDLAEKMVLVSGPRQCGKTTLAQRLVKRRRGAYFTWDSAAHRAALRRQELPDSAPLWVFDELHKLRGWQSWLKGIYDLDERRHSILVTGSARLDLLRRSGDSMQGRFFHTRLHPITLSELLGVRAIAAPEALLELAGSVPRRAQAELESLLRLGGFPEPLLSGSDRRAARWRLGYGELICRQEARDLEALHDLDRLERLYERLPTTVGSPLSVNALREDLEVAFATVASWLGALERLQALFRVPPWGPARIKAVKKAQKLYFWDWARVTAPAARIENLVAVHLLRLVHWLEDVHGQKAELRYLRDVVGHEVDFVVLRGTQPWLAVEVKASDGPLDPGLRYFLERSAVPFAFQVAVSGSLDRRPSSVGATIVRQLPLAAFLSQMP